jgi:acetoin utilization deacetylase AcuC-like enzyme
MHVAYQQFILRGPHMQVMIFDFDVHHGNGTNDFFHGDEDVLFVSTHQDGTYPGTGKISDVGSGDGEGATINLPLPGSQTVPCTVMFSMCFPYISFPRWPLY